jgi:hypothetical protein
MAWIKSNQNLERNPKIFDLIRLMSWDMDQAIGKLHRFWWWVTDYAPEGDLRKHSSFRIAQACGVTGEDAEKFLKALVECGFVDEKPYLRVHDWWDHAGSYLQIRYRDKADRWRSIRAMYDDNHSGSIGGSPTGYPKEEREIERERKKDTLLSVVDEMKQFWNSKNRLPKIKEWSEARLQKLATRLKDPAFCEQWRAAIDKLDASDFATGSGATGWKADIGWLLDNDTNYIKAIEGKYDNKEHRSSRFVKKI